VTTTAFLSGLGVMGRRHLSGLVARGIEVTAFDPSEASREKAREDLKAASIDPGLLSFAEETPDRRFDLALFSETARYRHANVKRFLERAEAGRFFLEKPLSADPAEVEDFPALFATHGVDTANVSCNLLRRTWDFVRQMKAHSDASPRIDMTVNGGAFGFGCNGIHLIDLFLFLTGCAEARVVHSQVDATPVASGRGTDIADFGGRFLVENERGAFYCAGSATSSAGVVFSLTGEHFMAFVDETDLTWRLKARKAGSDLPYYRCGHEYEVIADETAAVEYMSTSTGRWAMGELELPGLDDVMASHRLLHDILKAGGAEPPYSYT